MNCGKVYKHITTWLSSYLKKCNCGGFVVGVSGGIDSALVSTLCAKTGYPVFVLHMPMGESVNENALLHFKFLSKYINVSHKLVHLQETFEGIKQSFPTRDFPSELALANTQSRLRMCALYAYANTHNYLVAGTGNKVEDSGVGFFTKFGDGGVDISPIGDLLKSDVRELAEYLLIPHEILDAKPTDGLWEDGRTDEDQIGATYEELEWALKWCDECLVGSGESMDMNCLDRFKDFIKYKNLSDRQKHVLDIYVTRHEKNAHKMCIPPVCVVPKDYK